MTCYWNPSSKINEYERSLVSFTCKHSSNDDPSLQRLKKKFFVMFSSMKLVKKF